MAGQYHTLALTTDNELFAWGMGSYGRLGLNKNENVGTPRKVIFVDGCVNTSSTTFNHNDRSAGVFSDDRSEKEMLRTLGGVGGGSDTS